MANLVTDSQAKSWLDIPDAVDDARVAFLTAAASELVRGYCGRSFNVDSAQVASARYFTPDLYCTVKIDDCYEVTAVATDNGDDGSYGTTWATTDYLLLPPGGQGPYGSTGWPYTGIRAVEAREFPTWTTRPSVKVTGKWGWSSLPSDVTMATLMLVGEMFRAKSGTFEQFNADGSFTPIRQNRQVRDLLQKYKTIQSADARFWVG